MFQKIKDWWAGELINPNTDLESYIIFTPYMQRPFLARCLEILSNFVLANWQFLIGTGIGIAGLVLAYLALK